MKIYAINQNFKNNQRYNFKAINLSEEEKQAARKILVTSHVSDNPEEFNEKLFLIFDKHIQDEARLKAKSTYNFVDVLQNMYMEFIQALNNKEHKGSMLERIIETLNNYKPGKQDLKEGVDKNTVSLQESIYTSSKDGDELYLEDTITEEDRPIPLSQQSEEEREQSVKKVKEMTNGVLNDREQYIVKQKTMGFTYEQISEEIGVTVPRIAQIYKSSILKLQQENGTLSEEYKNKAKEFKERFSLEQSIDELTDMFIDNPQLLSKDIDEIENGVNGLSNSLGVEKEEFVKTALKQPQLLLIKPEIINQNVEDSAKLLGIEEEEFIKASLKYPALFCYKPETITNKINKISELFQTDRNIVVQKMLKHPLYFVSKLETIKLHKDINRYYNELQGKEQNENRFLYPSFNEQYSEILAFLMNKKAKMQLITITTSTQANLKNFLSKYNIFKKEDYILTFEVPDDPVLEGFIKFTDNFTQKTIGRNPFKFKKLYKIEDGVLNEKEKDIFNQRITGSKYTEIAENMQANETSVRYKFLSAIAKIQRRIGTLPKEYNDWAIALKERFSLAKSIDELIDILIDNPRLLSKGIDEIENNVNEASRLLGIEKEKFVKVMLKHPPLLNNKPETINQKVENNSKLLNITKEKYIKAALKQPTLFYMTMETLNQKINIITEKLGIGRKDLIKISQRNPIILASKPETINQKVEDNSKLLNLTREEYIKASLKTPRLLSIAKETLNQKINIIAEKLGIERKDVVKVALKHSQIFRHNSETMVKIVNDTATLLGIKIEEYTKVVLRRPALFYQKPQVINKKVNDISQSLNVENEKVIRAILKDAEFITYDIETIEQKVNDNVKLLGINREEFIKAALTKPQLFCQSPDTINKKISDTAEKLGITREEYIKAATWQPTLFMMDPETIKQKTDDFAKILNLDSQECIKAILKCPSLLYQDTKTAEAKITAFSNIFTVDKTIVIQKIINNPTLLTREPQVLKLQQDIRQYYYILQGKQPEMVESAFSYTSFLREFSRILAFLINKSTNKKLVPITGSIQRDLKNFLKEYDAFKNPDYTLTFEIPYAPVVDGLIEFTENYTNETIGRNPFKFNVIKN